ncbi:MAG: 3-methyl-2-oxobutanoate hydroxymethyltransferase [Candidatus Omnitrophica bacterium]|nr:3-methyl-2-oxobutanoate hydroxymethyltransferase [Candidatus Omnitrophota bacterium]
MTIPEILQKKKSGEKIIMLTAYDLPMARLLDEAGVDMVLVGDSLGMVALGYPATVPVTMREMIHHAKAVRRGVSKALVVGDMPFMSFNVSKQRTVMNAGRFVKEAGCDAVKVEGGQGSPASIEAVEAIVEAGIPVLGHVGLTPQTAGKTGGFKVQAKTAESAKKLLQAALALEGAGCFGIVLECVPVQVAGLITKSLSIPTIGIGAGPLCDGQVLVTHDLLGFQSAFHPKFVRRFADLNGQISSALKNFRQAVEKGSFPSDEESYFLNPDQEKLLKPPFRPRKRSAVIPLSKAR